MKILMIFQSAPLPPPRNLGGAQRNYPFLRENLKRHDVSVISFGTSEEESIFRHHFGGTCKHIMFVDRRRPRLLNGLEKLWLVMTGRSTFNQIYRRKLQKCIDELAATERFDLVHSCIPFFGRYRLPKNVPLLSDLHNVEYDLLHKTYLETTNIFMRMFAFLAYKLGKRFEIRQCKKFDVLTTATLNDLQTFRKDLPDKPMYVVQNGVGSEFFEVLDIKPEAKTMVFVGFFSYYPNVHAVRYFFEKIFPLVLAREPDAKLYVVGAYPPKDIQDRASDRVVVTGFVEDVRPFFAMSQVFIIPLLIGSGIRGKALEAMAMRIPIVSTTMACGGINLKHNESALFADTPEAFAEAIIHLFNNEAERRRLVQNAYSVVVQEHNWEKKGLELERVYKTLMSQSIGKSTVEGRP
jgi:polysaccharide biosynthesis protein PslH